jgi:hypothetical protein
MAWGVKRKTGKSPCFSRYSHRMTFYEAIKDEFKTTERYVIPVLFPMTDKNFT